MRRGPEEPAGPAERRLARRWHSPSEPLRRREVGMLCQVTSGSVLGIDAYAVAVEVDLSLGLPCFQIVGLPEAAVKESKTRVMAAIHNAGLRVPERKITVNLAPADVRKDGTAFDLPIALGVLAACGLPPPAQALADFLVVGELSLGGDLLPVKGVLPLAILARDLGRPYLIVPADNAREAAVVAGVGVLPARSLLEVVDHLVGARSLLPVAADPSWWQDAAGRDLPDLAEVRGQETAKRALEVAAAGGHNMLFVGPPGSGKTMLARRLPSVLPPLTFEEAVETTKIYSVAGRLAPGQGLVAQRPFRSPHHTISDVALIGGGLVPRPGEISLAHRGVLFLDELPEFKKNALEVLRQPLEEHRVHICRAQGSVVFPADVMLVVALNPCPCGYATDEAHRCACSPFQVQQYRARISGPLLDRIDLQVEVPALRYRELKGGGGGESSAIVRARVLAARERQLARLADGGLYCNAQMDKRELQRHCRIGDDGHRLLELAMDRLGMSARATDRILKVARTIADLAGAEQIGTAHLSEAIGYRSLDRGL